MFSDPYAKLCCTAAAVSQFGCRATYIDLDTAFAAYARARFLAAATVTVTSNTAAAGGSGDKDNDDNDNGNGSKAAVDIYLPSRGSFVSPMLGRVFDSMARSSLVVFDSVNSFYSMYRMSENRGTAASASTTGNLNHLLSVLLMLLARRSADMGIPVLVTSMLRYRKEGGWTQSPASRRLLQGKSVTKMSAERSAGGDVVVVTVAEHPLIPAGAEMAFRCEEKIAMTAAT